MGPYIRVLSSPRVALPLLASLAGALPIGMLSLGVLLLVRDASGSLTEAGAAAGALTLGNAVGAIVQGQLIDRRGQGVVLVGAGLLCGVSLGLLVGEVTHAGAAAVVGALALFAGASLPATTSSMRVLIPVLIPDSALRTAAYALLAAMFTAAMVAGPLLVTGLLVLGGATAPVLAAAGLAAAAAILFASTPPSRQWLPRRGVSAFRGRLTPGMRTLTIAALGSGMVNGMVGVGVPAIAMAHRAAASAGILFALAGLGDIVGGLVYGAGRWPLPLHCRLPLIQAGSALVVGCMGLVSDPAGLAPLMVLWGAASAPAAIAVSALLDRVAAEGRLTAAYTLVVAAGLAGSSGGYYVGGRLVVTAGGGLFAIAASTMVAVAMWTTLRRNTLRATLGGKRSADTVDVCRE